MPGAESPFGRVRSFVGSVRALLAERRCLRCAFPVSSERRHFSGLCPDCLALFTRRGGGYCPICGELTAWPHLPPAACARCLSAPPPWRAAFFYGVYEGALREALLGLKYGGRLHLASFLGRLLASTPGLRTWAEDMKEKGEKAVISPVPLHSRRQFQRGFNQSHELGRHLASSLGVPFVPGLLRRVRPSRPQSELSLEERQDNVKGIFMAAQAARGCHVLLLDDIFTTGATLREASLALLEKNAIAVSVASVARTESGLSAQARRHSDTRPPQKRPL